MSQAKKISMKLLVDKSKHKVLFAEAKKECVDFFFHILSLPLGTIVSYLTKESMVGSIGNLYGSLANLEFEYIQAGFDKEYLLHPEPPHGSASQVPLLDIHSAKTGDDDEDDLGSKTFYICAGASTYSYGSYYDKVHKYVSTSAGATCPYCKIHMTKTLELVAPPAPAIKAKAKNSSVGGYVKGVVTYMIMDDLSIEPMSTISGITLLNKFNVQDIGGLEERVVILDMKLGVALLKASLMSKTILTDVFLGKKTAI